MNVDFNNLRKQALIALNELVEAVERFNHKRASQAIRKAQRLAL